MKYVIYPVSEALSKWVRYFWSYDTDPHAEKVPLHIRSFADKYPRLIFQDIKDFDPITEPGNEIKPLCYISGIDTLPTEAFWSSAFSHFGVSFYPHALPVFFGVGADSLTNLTPDVHLLDKTALPWKLLQARHHDERVSLVTKYLYDKLQQGQPDMLINDWIHDPLLYAANWETGNVAQAARRYNISERQLQRRFKNAVGIPARKLQRIHKFEQALKRLSMLQYGALTGLAYELGYTDQAHFIKDFTAFSGHTPYAFMQQHKLGSESSSFIYTQE